MGKDQISHFANSSSAASATFLEEKVASSPVAPGNLDGKSGQIGPSPSGCGANCAILRCHPRRWSRHSLRARLRPDFPLCWLTRTACVTFLCGKSHMEFIGFGGPQREIRSVRLARFSLATPAARKLITASSIPARVVYDVTGSAAWAKAGPPGDGSRCAQQHRRSVFPPFWTCRDGPFSILDHGSTHTPRGAFAHEWSSGEGHSHPSHDRS